MKNLTKIILILIICIGYVFIINIFASLISISHENYEISKTTINGDIVKIKMSQSVSVQVTRAKKWYGQTHENDGNSYLHLFYICNLPWKIKNYNFIWFHFIFLTTLILLTILMFTKQSHKEVKKDEKCVEGNDNLGNFSNSVDM